jgi:DNA-binding GntR family transcriptional regulator
MSIANLKRSALGDVRVFATEVRKRGFRVRELSVKDIAGLTEARVEIESVALRLAIERGDVGWETKIVAAHHLLERTPVVDDDGWVLGQWVAHHRDFHQALTAGCNNARLQEVVLRLRAGAELYRRWWWAWLPIATATWPPNIASSWI